MKVDPKTASEIIKPRIDKWDATAPIDPMEVHREIYLSHVCRFLHLDPTPANVHRVTAALAHYGIDTDNFQEYPKEVDGKVVRSKDEHDALEKSESAHDPEPDDRPFAPAEHVSEQQPVHELS